MSRAGMADNIQRVRSLTFAGTADYALGTANYWDADQIEQVLDRHRVDVVRHHLYSEATYIGGGSVTYVLHRSQYGNLESGTALVVEDSVGDDRGTATYAADLQRGDFTFTTDQAGTVLYLTGRSYDTNAAAAELLEEWAASESRSFDFQTDGQSFSRSQKAQGLRDQARLLRKRSRVKTKRLLTER